MTTAALSTNTLVDEQWAWVSYWMNDEGRDLSPFGAPGTVHLEGCLQLNPKTIAIAIRPDQVETITQRCDSCHTRSRRKVMEQKRKESDAVKLEAARAQDPDLTRRVQERMAARRAKYVW